jgi:ankyrin repeat protein
MHIFLQACIRGDATTVATLLAQGADANALCSITNTTPLLEAVKNVGAGEHAAVVKLLLEASADPDRVPGSGPTGEPPGDSALQHAAAEGYLVRTDCTGPTVSIVS